MKTLKNINPVTVIKVITFVFLAITLTSVLYQIFINKAPIYL